MTITGTTSVTCPACGRGHDVTLVQSINVRQNPDLKARLLAGDLNVLACECGRRTQLLATLVYHDPERDYFCQACPGGEPAMQQGAAAFRAIGAVGTQRLVPSQNALVEKVKILDAGLADTVIEVLKVLLLSSSGHDINAILLFDRVDRDAGIIHWVHVETRQAQASPLAAYDKLAATDFSRPPRRPRVGARRRASDDVERKLTPRLAPHYNRPDRPDRPATRADPRPDRRLDPTGDSTRPETRPD